MRELQGHDAYGDDDNAYDDDAWDDSGDEGPLVFLCFTAADHAPAARLADDLHRHGVDVAGHDYRIGPGENVVLAAEEALTESDYFVLLWSRDARQDPWLDEVRSAAFARGLRERRRFFFVVRLDGTPLPALLAARPQLDARADWDRAVGELVATWRRESAFGDPVLPAPAAPERPPEHTVYVWNRALHVNHKLEHVPPGATGREFGVLARAELQLPRRVTEFDGSVGLRFSYRFLYGGEPLPEDKPLAAAGVRHGDQVQLEVGVEPFGPVGGSAEGVYLDGVRGDTSDGTRGDTSYRLSPALVRSLADEAFSHLRPGSPR